MTLALIDDLDRWARAICDDLHGVFGGQKGTERLDFTITYSPELVTQIYLSYTIAKGGAIDSETTEAKLTMLGWRLNSFDRSLYGEITLGLVPSRLANAPVRF